MCGILGALGPGVAANQGEGAKQSALDALRHRGPDDEGLESGPGWCLGFRRLAILDLEATGHQPMFTPERDAVLVFNGEIYNFPELREELRQSGEVCRSTGDAEVLLRLLRRDGKRVLDRLNGMFAFAFIDFRTRRFLLARDRVGVKPLYVTFLKDQLLFASELAALLLLLDAQPVVDKLALNRYLALSHIPPPLTIWKGVQKLPSAGYFEGSLDSADEVKFKRWWQLNGEQRSGRPPADWLEEVDATLADATRVRLRSDVPVGVFLSGGIDSGLVCYYAAHQPGFRKPTALTVTFAEQDFSEFGIAQQVARSTGVAHESVNVSSADLRSLPTIAWHCGEPFGDASVVNQYQLAEAAQPHATVFLTGDGGDEAFGGYDEYVRMAHHGKYVAAAAACTSGLASAVDRFLPGSSLLRQQLWKLSGGYSGFGALVRQNFRDPCWSHLLHPDWRLGADEVEQQAWNSWDSSATLPLVTRMQRFDYDNYLESDVLVKVDRATMAHSLEARSPFLDYRVVELAARIPYELHLEGLQGKSLLRTLAKRHLPGDVFSQPKRGFDPPIKVWFRENLAGRIRDLLLGERAQSRGWWSFQGLSDLLRWHSELGRREWHDLIWRVLMLEMWARVFLDGDRSPLVEL